jgi:hypothetical protein
MAAVNEDEGSDGDRENVHIGRKREAPRHAGNARKRKKTSVKNTAAIEALELATEQTLKVGYSLSFESLCLIQQSGLNQWSAKRFWSPDITSESFWKKFSSNKLKYPNFGE